MKILALILCFFLSFALPSLAVQCGWEVGGKTCPKPQCCSNWGWCGTSTRHCSPGYCQSSCRDDLLVLSDVGEVISKQAFERMMLLHGNGISNTGVGFDTYEAFITAAKSFPSFGNTGTVETRKRELAAFLAQTLHGIAGNDWLTKNEAVSYFKTAIWSWMTPQSSKPSHHQVFINQGNSTSADTTEAGRLPGYTVVTYIISGGLQSDKGYDANIAERIGFYIKYADILGVSYDKYS